MTQPTLWPALAKLIAKHPHAFKKGEHELGGVLIVSSRQGDAVRYQLAGIAGLPLPPAYALLELTPAGDGVRLMAYLARPPNERARLLTIGEAQAVADWLAQMERDSPAQTG